MKISEISSTTYIIRFNYVFLRIINNKPHNTRFVNNLLNEATVLPYDLPHKISGDLMGLLGVLQHHPGLFNALFRFTNNLDDLSKSLFLARIIHLLFIKNICNVLYTYISYCYLYNHIHFSREHTTFTQHTTIISTREK